MRRFSNFLTAILLSGAFLFGTPTTNTPKKKRKSAGHKTSTTAAARKALPNVSTATASTATVTRSAVVGSGVGNSSAAVVRTSLSTSPRSPVMRRRRVVVSGGPWRSPTYADSTLNDNVDGEDLEIRRAAVEALGPYNGSVVVVDPTTGRILTIVNQHLALQGGFIPCSTIKLVAALAALT